MGPKCARIPNYDGHHYVGTWVDTALEGLYNATSATVDGPTDPSSGGVKCAANEKCPDGKICPASGKCGGCIGAKCMWFNESAPHVTTVRTQASLLSLFFLSRSGF